MNNLLLLFVSKGKSMSELNPHCDGKYCADPQGEVRLYPLGTGEVLHFCRSCWAHANWYRKQLVDEHMAMAKCQRDADSYYNQVKNEAAKMWPQLDWYAAPSKEKEPTNGNQEGNVQL